MEGGFFHPLGITPARAGNSHEGFTPVPCVWNYPRSCGEQSGAAKPAKFIPELPPLVRGTAPRRRRPHPRRGITPARAGNSSSKSYVITDIPNYPRSCGQQALRRSPPLPRGGNYPRSCGEQGKKCRPLHSTKELPPLVRGTAGFIRIIKTKLGITPARAGNRLNAIPYLLNFRNYPRSCGEQRDSSAS